MAASHGDETRTNERIRAREVRLIDPDGQQLGIKALPEALSIARSMELDLVEVAPDARPPVCRIMNFTKFKYEAQQRAKESRKKATNIVVKEMKYRPKIGVGDFDTKTRKVAQFLGEGHKVKITIMFRGREMQHPELGRRILDRVAQEVAEVGKVEIMAKQDGRNMTMVLGPDKKAQDLAKALAKKAGDAATNDAIEDGVVDTDLIEADTSDAQSDAIEATEGTTPEVDPQEANPEEANPEEVNPEEVNATDEAAAVADESAEAAEPAVAGEAN